MEKKYVRNELTTKVSPDAKEEVFEGQQDCRKSSRTDCRHRNVPVVLSLNINTEEGSQNIQCEEGENLLEILIKQGYRLPSPCGGMGRCGKCQIQIVEGVAKVTSADQASFSEKELEEGWRLACKVILKHNMTVFVPQEHEHQILETGTVLVTQENLNDTKEEKKEEVDQEKTAYRYVAAIDIGTTTIVFQLLDKESKEIVHTVSMLNGQRKFGADVISRIQSSMSGKKEDLKKAIQEDLKCGMKKLLEECKAEDREISQIVIGANTTMIHLLMGYDCSTLGVFPFEAVELSTIKTNWKELVQEETFCATETILFPGISVFVGGDISAGLYACGFDRKEEVTLLIDLGTNGEMALGNKERLLVTSTAAGPAFEGGNISCGTGSIAGAVCGVEVIHGKTKIRTLLDEPPIGICGTGVIELMAELRKENIVDETGLLLEEYFEEGFPVAQTAKGKWLTFTQGDIRELQLAKAAIRAGIEVLLKRYGVSKAQVAQVYIAGGFGYSLNQNKAIAIGMLPEEFRDKVVAVGNSCIAGLGRFLKERDGEETIHRLISKAKEINLAMDAEFQNYYMEAMMFETNLDK